MAQSTNLSENPSALPLASQTSQPSTLTAATAADSQGRTPLYNAAITGDISLLTTLLRTNTNTSSIETGILHTRETPLHAAATHGHSAAVTLLLCSGARINAPDAFSRTPLMRAVLADRMSVVQTLLDWKGEDGGGGSESESVDVNAVDVQGETALMKAAVWGRAEIVGVSLSRGADLAVVDGEDGWNAGMHAAAWGKGEVVRLLSDGCGGCEWWEVKDKHGRAALEIAERRGRMGVVEMLRERSSGTASRT